jgi:hypothetical protein
MVGAVKRKVESRWSYGVEHEWADWPLDATLPKGSLRNLKDHTIVNSNGIANDPSGKLYGYGGEINSMPTFSIEEQVDVLKDLVKALPEAKVNYRSNLHVHIRVPGLKDDLATLKRVQSYIHTNMPKAFPIIQPLPKPTMREYPKIEDYLGAIKRWKRRKVSHQTLLTEKRVQKQLAAKTVDDFFMNEVPRTEDGTPKWHLQPRVCVSLRQLLDTDTIEFRHFFGTLDPDLFRNCLLWCDWFLRFALDDKPFDSLLSKIALNYVHFPSFPMYDHDLEKRYRATVHDGTLSSDRIKANIAAILAGKPFKSDWKPSLARESLVG